MLRVVRVVGAAHGDRSRQIDSVVLGPDQRRLQTAHIGRFKPLCFAEII